MATINKVYKVEGMSCVSCERMLTKKIGQLEGIVKISVDYNTSKAHITYDDLFLDMNKINETVEKAGYSLGEEIVKGKKVSKSKESKVKTRGKRDVASNKKKVETETQISNAEENLQLLGVGVIAFSIYLIVKYTIGFNMLPEVDSSMGYGILFLVGILTSFHCIAMCGGINLSQSIGGTGDKPMRSALLYNGGRVISYTVVGGLAGGLGSVVSFSGGARGIMMVVAGVFMLIMGINMLNIFPWLRRLNPRMPKFIGNLVHRGEGNNGPLMVGLLNGLMPCGPLQTMQIYALGTASIFGGALSMFLFSLGTVPLMLGFGVISAMLSKRFAHKIMKIGAIMVVILGLVMANRGLALSGVALNIYKMGIIKEAVPAEEQLGGERVTIGNSEPREISIETNEDGVQLVSGDVTPSGYPQVTVKAGQPVKLTLNAAQGSLNGCNNSIVIQEFGIEKKLTVGENVIEFTPTETGTIGYSCWMGMVQGRINVI